MDLSVVTRSGGSASRRAAARDAGSRDGKIRICRRSVFVAIFTRESARVSRIKEVEKYWIQVRLLCLFVFVISNIDAIISANVIQRILSSIRD